MVVDLETHDWTHRDPLLASGCIVEIAWKLFSDTGDCLESKLLSIGKLIGNHTKVISN